MSFFPFYLTFQESKGIPKLKIQHSSRHQLLIAEMTDKFSPDLTKTFPCEQTIGYYFQDKNLLWEALQTDGSPKCPTDNPRYEVGNKRLAIVGNLAMDLLLTSIWHSTGNASGKILSLLYRI